MSRTGRSAMLDRSLNVASTPSRSADQRFSAIRHSRGTANASCSDSHATRQCTKAVTAAASSSVVCASHTRTSSVPNVRCGRSSHHHDPGSGTAHAIASAYSSQDANAGGTLWRGSSPLMSGRTEAKPVSRPAWNGAFAARAASSGRYPRSAL